MGCNLSWMEMVIIIEQIKTTNWLWRQIEKKPRCLLFLMRIRELEAVKKQHFILQSQ